MLRRKLLIFAVITVSAQAALLPERFGTYTRGDVTPVTVADRPVWDEYGFDSAEQSTYKSVDKQAKVTAYRLKDPTGALAGFQWLRPAGATSIKLTPYAAQFKDTILLLTGNYLLTFEGYQPVPMDLKQIISTLPRYDQSSLPSLLNYIPASRLVANSQRFVMGPASLQQFEPRISPSIAGFHYGAEAQLAKYRTKNGESQLVLFSYPTPQMARERQDAFQKIEGAFVKRTGPLVAVIVSPPDPDDAERLLAQVKYEPEITWSEKVPVPQVNAGDMLTTILILSGVLICLSVLFGFFLGGFRVAMARFGIGTAHASFTSLDIQKK